MTHTYIWLDVLPGFLLIDASKNFPNLPGFESYIDLKSQNFPRTLTMTYSVVFGGPATLIGFVQPASAHDTRTVMECSKNRLIKYTSDLSDDLTASLF